MTKIAYTLECFTYMYNCIYEMGSGLQEWWAQGLGNARICKHAANSMHLSAK